MSARLFFVTGLVVVSLGLVLGAPKAIHSEKDLKHSLVEFLKQDVNFLSELERTAALAEGANLRHRRQAELDETDSQSVDSDAGDIEVQQQDGFFNRAARFVMDLLQRFLKWINTDSN